MGSDGSAAGGRESDLSEWQRSTSNEGVRAKAIVGHRNRIQAFTKNIYFNYTCRCDGIGRRSGLKIHRWRQRTGSSPVTGTKKADTHSGICFFVMPVGLEPQVRVRGVRGALPVADEATRASGRGRCATQPRPRQGAHRAPQQDTRHHKSSVALQQSF